MKMRSGLATLLCAGIATCLLTAANAAVILSDNFDSYADTAAFVAGGWTVNTGTGGTLSSTQSFSSANSINIGTAASRNLHTLSSSAAPTPTQNVAYSVRFYVTNTSQGRQQV